VLLRVSGSATKIRVDLDALVSDQDSDCGVPAGSGLRRFARALVRETPGAGLSELRDALISELGIPAAVDAAAVAAFFNGLDRVADATGTDPDEPTMELVGQWLPTWPPDVSLLTR
jgi:hypothetical protein